MDFSELTQHVNAGYHIDQALGESEHRFEAFMGHLPGYAWIKDPDGKYLYINEPLQKMLPLYKNDWHGRTDEDLWPENAVEYRRNDLIVLQERRELQTIENWFFQGQMRLLLVSKFPIFDDDNGILVGGISIDITEHKHAELSRDKAEEKFRDIFENAREGIFQSTPEGQYLVANPALARMHGYESPEALIAGCKDISHQIYADPLRREEFKLLLETAGLVKDFEMKTRRKDGSNLWVSVNARAVRDAEGMLLYYEGTTQDITDRKRAQEKSAAFATLARKLSGATTQLTAARVIAQTARDLFGWDACNLDLYDVERDWVLPLLNIDTVDGKEQDVTPLIKAGPPTERGRRVINGRAELLLRKEPIEFDAHSIPFGDTNRPSASMMSVPIQYGPDVIGMLSIQSYTPRAYDETALKDCVSLAEHCGKTLNRIHAEGPLQESEERFRQLAEHLEDVIWIADRELTRVLYINPAYEKIFGRSSQRLYRT